MNYQLKKISIVTFLIFFNISCKTTQKISYKEYENLLTKYAEVIINNNQTTRLRRFRSESDLSNALIVNRYKDCYDIFIVTFDVDLSIYKLKIPKNIELFVYSAMYDKPLFVYDNPHLDAAFFSIQEYITTPLKVLDVEGTWIKITFNYNSIDIEGWIPRHEYCSNPYSTCN